MRRDRQTILRRAGFLATMVVLAAVGTSVIARAHRPGCDSEVGPIKENAEFTPYESQLSHLPPVALATQGQRVMSSEQRMDGLSLRWQAGDGHRSLYRYYLERELESDMTPPEFYGAGGIQLDRDLVDGEPFSADRVVELVGDRAVIVQIGNYEGALVWADPESSNEPRPHHLSWSDGNYNYSLIAVRGPQRMVQLARELTCGG